jgi:hypothetical protein
MVGLRAEHIVPSTAVRLMHLVLTGIRLYEMRLLTISLCSDKTDPGGRAV